MPKGVYDRSTMKPRRKQGPSIGARVEQAERKLGKSATPEEIAAEVQRLHSAKLAEMAALQRDMSKFLDRVVAALEEADRLMTASYRSTDRWVEEVKAWRKTKR